MKLNDHEADDDWAIWDIIMEGNTSDLEPRDTLEQYVSDKLAYSQQPEQLGEKPMENRFPLRLCRDDQRWSEFNLRCEDQRGNQMDPTPLPAAEELYRHQPDPAEQSAIHTMRTFSTGATRDMADNKPDYKGYLSPLALRHYGRYMLKHQKQANGTMRPSDNWKKGIPEEAYAQSLIRHVVEFWLAHELGNQAEEEEEALDAMIFNAMGILHEREKARHEARSELTTEDDLCG